MRKVVYYGLCLCVAVPGILGVYNGVASIFRPGGAVDNIWVWGRLLLNMVFLAVVAWAAFTVRPWAVRILSLVGSIAAVKFIAEATGLGNAIEQGAWGGTAPLIACALVAVMYFVLRRGLSALGTTRSENSDEIANRTTF
jgi:hypothetical protein